MDFDPDPFDALRFLFGAWPPELKEAVAEVAIAERILAFDPELHDLPWPAQVEAGASSTDVGTLRECVRRAAESLRVRAAEHRADAEFTEQNFDSRLNAIQLRRGAAHLERAAAWLDRLEGHDQRPRTE